MTRRSVVFFALLLLIAMVTTAAGHRRDGGRGRPATGFDAVIDDHARDLVERGRQIFRFDTFGDEDFWGGTLQLHKAIAGERLGGGGPGVSPRTALAVGLKVDADALPRRLIASLQRGLCARPDGVGNGRPRGVPQEPVAHSHTQKEEEK